MFLLEDRGSNGLGDEFKYRDLICENIYAERVKFSGNAIYHGSVREERDDETGYMISPVMHMPEELANDPEALQETGMADRLLLGEDGKPMAVGHTYAFSFSRNMNRLEKYPVIIELWERPFCNARRIYARMKTYYNELKNKYEHAEELDNDDF